jgi:methyl-accepting chemotaxis protein
MRLLGTFRPKILLTHKVVAIGGAGVVSVLALAAIFITGAWLQDRYARMADAARATAATVSRLHIDLLESRRAEKDFFLRNDMKYAQHHAKISDAVAKELDELRAQSADKGDATFARKIDAIGTGYGAYDRSFKASVDTRVRLGLHETAGLEGALRNSVHAIESKLNEFHEPDLLVIMLMMRRHEKDFMLRREAQYGEELKKRAGEFTVALNTVTLPAAAKADLVAKLADYQRDFAAWMQAALGLAAQQKTTSEAYATVEPVIEEMLQSTKADFDAALAANQATRDSTMLRIEIAIGVITIVLSGFAFGIGRSLSRPIKAMTLAMRRLGEGNFDVVLPGLGRRDEIGEIASAVETFKVKAAEKARLEADEMLQRQKAEAEAAARAAEERAKAAEEQARVVDALADGLGKLADGELAFRLSEADFTDAYKQIKNDFNSAIGRLQSTVAALAGATREVADTAGEISSATTSLSQRTEEQAASLEETSASMEQISATVKKNAENAQRADQFTAGTRDVADKGGAVVAQAVGAMARIEESSRKISDIISVIDEIARQTNLLALNAAVEAARAGEAGRGFAVVASEVRTLAQRSSQAAKDIKDLITNSTSQVTEGVDLVNRAGASLTEIVASIKNVAAIVSEIASASAEQSTGIDQVNTAITQMDEVTQQNSALVEQNAAAARSLQQQAQEMDKQVGFFRIGDVMIAAPDAAAA